MNSKTVEYKNIANIEACEQKCLDETTFTCLSLDYKDEKCRLSSEIRRTPTTPGKSQGVKYDKNYIYSEKNCGTVSILFEYRLLDETGLDYLIFSSSTLIIIEAE